MRDIRIIRKLHYNLEPKSSKLSKILGENSMDFLWLAKTALGLLIKHGCTVERISDQIDEDVIGNCYNHLKGLCDGY